MNYEDMSPEAQAIFGTADLFGNGGKRYNSEFAAVILRAVADQVVPKEWPTIEDYNEYEQGVAAAHIKHRNQILAIADELEAQ